MQAKLFNFRGSDAPILFEQRLINSDFQPMNRHKQLINIKIMLTANFKSLSLSNYHFEMKLHNVKFRIFVVDNMERVFRN